jgi:hypothetical protein
MMSENQMVEMAWILLWILLGILLVVLAWSIALKTLEHLQKRSAAKKLDMYKHHGAFVVVRSDLKGKHRKHCLCFQGCTHFNPGNADNCRMAEKIYQLCRDFNMVTPVWECPAYYQKQG